MLNLLPAGFLGYLFPFQKMVMAEYKFRGIDMEGAKLLDDENGNRRRLRAGKVRFL